MYFQISWFKISYLFTFQLEFDKNAEIQKREKNSVLKKKKKKSTKIQLDNGKKI